MVVILVYGTSIESRINGGGGRHDGDGDDHGHGSSGGMEETF